VLLEQERELLAEEQQELFRESMSVTEAKLAVETLQSRLASEIAEMESERSRRREWQEALEGQDAELRRRSDALDARAESITAGQLELRQRWEAFEAERAEVAARKADVDAAEEAAALQSEETARLSKDVAARKQQLLAEQKVLAANQQKVREQEEALGTAVHEERTRTAEYEVARTEQVASLQRREAELTAQARRGEELEATLSEHRVPPNLR
jgi:hypothetical protein